MDDILRLFVTTATLCSLLLYAESIRCYDDTFDTFVLCEEKFSCYITKTKRRGCIASTACIEAGWTCCGKDLCNAPVTTTQKTYTRRPVHEDGHQQWFSQVQAGAYKPGYPQKPGGRPPSWLSWINPLKPGGGGGFPVSGIVGHHPSAGLTCYDDKLGQIIQCPTAKYRCFITGDQRGCTPLELCGVGLAHYCCSSNNCNLPQIGTGGPAKVKLKCYDSSLQSVVACPIDNYYRCFKTNVGTTGNNIRGCTVMSICNIFGIQCCDLDNCNAEDGAVTLRSNIVCITLLIIFLLIK